MYACASEHLKFKSIKATFTVNARLSQFVAFILDVDNYSNWQYNTIHSRLLKRINEKEVLFYTEIAAPWPVNNRDMVIDLLVSQDIKTREVTITARSVPQEVPQKDRIVRVPTSHAAWTVVPLSSSLLKVEYFIGIDPGGSVPAWMINMVSAEAPLMSFKTLKDKIHQKKYLNAQVPFIVDY